MVVTLIAVKQEINYSKTIRLVEDLAIRENMHSYVIGTYRFIAKSPYKTRHT